MMDNQKYMILWRTVAICLKIVTKYSTTCIIISYHNLFFYFLYNMSHVMRKPTFWFPTWSDTNQAVQPQKMARVLKFRIKKEEG